MSVVCVKFNASLHDSITMPLNIIKTLLLCYYLVRIITRYKKGCIAVNGTPYPSHSSMKFVWLMQTNS